MLWKLIFKKEKKKKASKCVIKKRVCRFRPRWSSNPQNENYPKHCKYSLIRFKPFRSKEELFTDETPDQEFVESWTQYLRENPDLPIPKYKQQLENAEYVLQCIDNGEDVDAPPHEIDGNYNWFKKNVQTILTEDKVPVCTFFLNQL